VSGVGGRKEHKKGEKGKDDDEAELIGETSSPRTPSARTAGKKRSFRELNILESEDETTPKRAKTTGDEGFAILPGSQVAEEAEVRGVEIDDLNEYEGESLFL
jgi:hypothetical protein